MKNKFLMSIAISSLFLLGACGDDSESASLADMCGEGITEDCFIGNWTLESISTIDSKEVLTSFASSPGKLVVNEGTFSYTTSATLTSDPLCAGVTNHGTWTLQEKTITFKTTNGDCISPSGSFTPEVSVIASDAGDKAILSLKKVVFQLGEKNAMYANNESETFFRTEE